MRSAAQRRADALAKLEGDTDIWVATAADGVAHLVPLSMSWDGQDIVVATEATSRTARNAAASGQARVAMGTSRDVVMVDATVQSVPAAEAEAELVSGFVARTGWDPSAEGGEWVYLRLRPERVQVWNGVDELPQRTVMRDGRWLA